MVASEKSFSRAAELCGVTQPTLSAGIKQLEDTLGVLLVNRSSRFHGLTAEGERVLEWAKRIVGDTRAMRQDVRALKEGLTGPLRIAVIPTALGIVTKLTETYRRKHPNVRFTVLSASSTDVLTMLEEILRSTRGLPTLIMSRSGACARCRCVWSATDCLQARAIPWAIGTASLGLKLAKSIYAC